MKYQILIEMLFMLLANKKVTVKEFMQRFELKRRTVFRYIDTLTLANLPVSVIHGRGGGFFIPQEYKVPFAYFTAEEADTLISALKDFTLIGEKDKLALTDKITAIKPESSVK